MNESNGKQIAAGLSLLFAPHARPDGAAMRAALERCQAAAQVTHEDAGELEIVASGLSFVCDGLAPAPAIPGGAPASSYHFAAAPDCATLHAVRLYPGAHLSGGLTLEPVTRALLALAAELAAVMPVEAVHWHAADTSIEPAAFSRSVLAWLAGGAFPALGLTALSTLSDGSVVSQGLAHFVGQELSLRAPGREDDAVRLAAGVIDKLVRSGPLASFTTWTVHGVELCAEPARQARQVLVWTA